MMCKWKLDGSAVEIEHDEPNANTKQNRFLLNLRLPKYIKESVPDGQMKRKNSKKNKTLDLGL